MKTKPSLLLGAAFLNNLINNDNLKIEGSVADIASIRYPYSKLSPEDKETYSKFANILSEELLGPEYFQLDSGQTVQVEVNPSLCHIRAYNRLAYYSGMVSQSNIYFGEHPSRSNIIDPLFDEAGNLLFMKRKCSDILSSQILIPNKSQLPPDRDGQKIILECIRSVLLKLYGEQVSNENSMNLVEYFFGDGSQYHVTYKKGELAIEHLPSYSSPQSIAAYDLRYVTVGRLSAWVLYVRYTSGLDLSLRIGTRSSIKNIDSWYLVVTIEHYPYFKD